MLQFLGYAEDGMFLAKATALLIRSQPWGFKWWGHYRNEWLYGLKDRPRSGRPPLMAKS